MSLFTTSSYSSTQIPSEEVAKFQGRIVIQSSMAVLHLSPKVVFQIGNGMRHSAISLFFHGTLLRVSEESIQLKRSSFKEQAIKSITA